MLAQTEPVPVPDEALNAALMAPFFVILIILLIGIAVGIWYWHKGPDKNPDLDL